MVMSPVSKDRRGCFAIRSSARRQGEPAAPNLRHLDNAARAREVYARGNMSRTRQQNVTAAQWSANGEALGAQDLTEPGIHPFGENVFR